MNALAAASVGASFSIEALSPLETTGIYVVIPLLFFMLIAALALGLSKSTPRDRGIPVLRPDAEPEQAGQASNIVSPRPIGLDSSPVPSMTQTPSGADDACVTDDGAR